MVCDSRREQNKILSVFLTFHLSHFFKFLLSTKRKRLSIKHEYNEERCESFLAMGCGLEI